MSLISGTSRQPLARHRRTPMAAAGVYRRPLDGGGVAMGFDEDTPITYDGGSVIVPADQDAVLYPAGTSPVLTLDTTGYCLFVQPGSSVLWACAQQDYAAVATAIDIVPRVWAGGPDDLWLVPRHVVPPIPPGSPLRYLRIFPMGASPGFLGNWAVGGAPSFGANTLDLVPATPGAGGASSEEEGVALDTTPPRFGAPPILPAYQFISEPLAARHVPAGSWSVGYLPFLNNTLTNAPYQGYAWIGLASGVPIVPVSAVGPGVLCGGLLLGVGTIRTVFGTVAGAAIDIPAGDRLVLELGLASSLPGVNVWGVFTGGSDPVVANSVVTRNANSVITAPIPF